MNALHEFWAKSLLNKLVLVGLVGVVCCCPPGLAGVGGGGGTATTGATATAEGAARAELAATAGPTATPAPTRTPLPAAPTVPAEARRVTAIPEYASGGLGLSRAAWEARRGKPTKEAASVFFYGGRLSVMYYDGLVWHIEYSLGNPGEPLAEAREVARLLLPQDAALIETYTTSIGQLVDRYRSPSLATRFPNENWTNGEPGNHIVIYRRLEGSDLVFGIVIGVGNNP